MVKLALELENLELQTGEQKRLRCPTCKGGNSGEKSLSITKTESGLLWNCFRASCSEKGNTGDPVLDVPSSKVITNSKTVDIVTYPLGPKAWDYIENTWHITEVRHWYWTLQYQGRLAMSVRSPKYMHRGWCLRDIRGELVPKVLTYIEDGEEGLSWYREHLRGPTIVVEDIPSAVRANRYVNSVALLGTGIGPERAIEIADYATRPIIMALDQDATDLSFKWANKWSLLWGDVEVLPLTKDLKNMTEDELMELLQ